jgi:hypothetical protein
MRARFGVVALLPLLAGCGVAFGAGAGVHYDEGDRENGYYEDAYYEDAYYGSRDGDGRYDRGHGRRVDYRRLPVPRGHVPPAGRCRVWLPGVPPWHQPNSGSCARLERRVPPGAWLLVRPARAPGVVELLAFDDRRPRVRLRYLYDIRSGRRLTY